MTRLLLVRHAEPDATWGGAVDDPGLSAAGLDQASATASALAGYGELAVVSSPLRRCAETAQAYSARVGIPARFDARVGEVQAPAGAMDRRAWLLSNFPWREALPHREWSELAPALHAWREQVLAALREVDVDVVIFTHFVAINVIVGAALDRNETIVCRPAHASITELARNGASLDLVRLGAQMSTDDVR